MKGRRELEHPVMVASVVEEQEKKLLEEIGWRERLSTSEIARKAIIEYIKAHGEGNDSFKMDGWIENPELQAVPTLFGDYEKWTQYYKDCNPEDRLKVRISLVRIFNVTKNIEFDEGRKVKDLK